MKRIEDIKNFEDIDTYYEISNIVEEVFQDRVEAHKHLVTANKEIERLNNIINKYVEDMEDYLESNPPVDMQDYTYRVRDIEFLEEGIEELKFITTIREKLKELKGSEKE